MDGGGATPGGATPRSRASMPGAALLAAVDDLQRTSALDAAATAALRAELAHERTRRAAAERAFQLAAQERDAACAARDALEDKVSAAEKELAELAQQLYAVMFGGAAGAGAGAPQPLSAGTRP